MASENIYADPILGNVIFRKKKGLKRLSIRVHPVEGVSVNIPWLVPQAAAMAFFRLKRDWVIKAFQRQRERVGDVPVATDGQIEAMRLQAKRTLPPRLKELARRYGFTYNRVAIKHNSSNWGSCSAKNNINLNLNIVRLPAPLRDYILLHELCHLRHRDHGEAFHLLLEHLCTDNLMRLADDADQDALALARAAALCRARFPIDHLAGKALKQYPLL